MGCACLESGIEQKWPKFSLQAPRCQLQPGPCLGTESHPLQEEAHGQPHPLQNLCGEKVSQRAEVNMAIPGGRGLLWAKEKANVIQGR